MTSRVTKDAINELDRLLEKHQENFNKTFMQIDQNIIELLKKVIAYLERSGDRHKKDVYDFEAMVEMTLGNARFLPRWQVSADNINSELIDLRHNTSAQRYRKWNLASHKEFPPLRH